MSKFIPWNSQPLDVWADRYAEGKFIDPAGRRTHYVERGHGKPVILIFGFNPDFHTWIKNLDQLAARFKVYAPDLWGQGYSARQPEGRSGVSDGAPHRSDTPHEPRRYLDP